MRTLLIMILFQISIKFFKIFFHPRLPVDWDRSLFTYSIAFALDVLGSYLVSKLGSFILMLMVGSYIVINRFTKDIKQEMITLNENWKTNRNEKELLESICGIAWFIARIDELSSISNRFDSSFI